MLLKPSEVLLSRRLFIVLVMLLLVVTIACAQSAVPQPALLCGTLQSQPEHAVENVKAGLRLGTLELNWDRWEPREGEFNATAIAQARRHAEKLHAAGLEVVLDLGLQYPPQWLFELPDSRFVNQYGQSFVAKDIGGNGANAVFNQAIRQRQAAYVARVFKELGTDFFAVRLGWCHWGELQYPFAKYREHTNCYWGYDDLAQGKKPGLPSTLKPCPQPGFTPGQVSVDHKAAQEFADWYLAAMQDYHDWQIATVRQHYTGNLAMLYPSWGLRPGQIEAAVWQDLAGKTSPEINGELQRGYDFARFIRGIKDAKVIVYTTWLDADPKFGNDDGDNQAQWSPAHYLSALADAHPLKLRKWGENTGPGDRKIMELCVQRAKRFGLLGFMWAFEKDLYSGKSASIADFQQVLQGAKQK